MSEKIIKIGISHGDINGIGYELILKTFEDIRLFESCIPVIYGSSKVLAYQRKAMNLSPVNFNTINHAGDAGMNRLNVINCGNEDVTVEFSRSTPESESLAQAAFRRALSDLKSGLIDVLVMAPANGDGTDVLSATSVPGKHPLKMLINDAFRIALTSDKIPLSEIASYLTVDLLTAQIKALHSALIHDFMVTNPRIAVLSLNPGMGIKEKSFGNEESEVIVPSIKAANDAGVICFGPYSADDFFGNSDYLKFDATLAMYYDQGLIPFRSIVFEGGICYWVDLPFVVTAPDQSVSYEKAGKNESSEIPFRNALYSAIDIFNTRKLDSEIYANPLKKQYFERGSDNEKLDLTETSDE
jgi:4-hydroxythreonine-4-phosphate dehydrogenase